MDAFIIFCAPLPLFLLILVPVESEVDISPVQGRQ